MSRVPPSGAPLERGFAAGEDAPLLGSGHREDGTHMLKIGDPMPAFSLRSSDREEVTEQHFAGSIAVLAFYPMAFTPG